MPIEIEYYGNATGGETHTVTLNCGALKAVFCDYGARLLELCVPDRNGDLADVVLANGNIEAFQAGNAYFGATCGRFANRIKGGRFTLDGQRYQVGLNDGPNHLHGGPIGFDKRIWRIEVDETNNAVRFSMVSPDGDQGYPGEVTANVEYTLGAGLVGHRHDRRNDRAHLGQSGEPRLLEFGGSRYGPCARPARSDSGGLLYPCRCRTCRHR